MLWRLNPDRSGETRERFVDELRQFDGFSGHQALIIAVVEREHAEALSRHTSHHGGRRARATTFDWVGYRNDMYRHVIVALTGAGHEDESMRLERYRAKNSDRW